MNGLSLYLTAPRVLTFTEELLPDLAADEVLVRTLYGALSIGTELPLYEGTSRSSQVSYPKMTGYESYGVIEAVGKDVTDFQTGDKVVTFYGHKTHAVVSALKLIRVPETLSPSLALLAILSCDVKKGILKLTLHENETVLITGAGAIGLLTLFTLKALHIQTVDVIEPQPRRCELALMLGARNVFNSKEISTQLYDAGLECSSHNQAFATLQAQLKHDGRICILADGNLEPLTPQFHEKELCVVGSSDGIDYQDHAAWFYALPNLEKLANLFDLETTFHDLSRTFEVLAKKEKTAVKVLVRYT